MSRKNGEMVLIFIRGKWNGNYTSAEESMGRTYA
jgi:hypothetical protein